MEGFQVSRFSVFEEENRAGIQGNARIYIDGRQITNVQVADAMRGAVKQLVLDIEGQPMADRTRGEARTADFKGYVEIIIQDVPRYISEQRARLDEIEANPTRFMRAGKWVNAHGANEKPCQEPGNPR